MTARQVTRCARIGKHYAHRCDPTVHAQPPALIRPHRCLHAIALVGTPPCFSQYIRKALAAQRLLNLGYAGFS
jgi:hypothetical protein